MLSCNFWIIGGQHTIEAMRDVVINPLYTNNKDLSTYCKFHEIVIVWSLDKETLMYMSKVLNLKNHDKDTKLSSFKDVTQRQAVWEDHKYPQPVKLKGIHSTQWNVSSCPLAMRFVFSYTLLCIKRPPNANAFVFLPMFGVGV